MSLQALLVPVGPGIPRCPHPLERRLLPFSDRTLSQQALYIQLIDDVSRDLPQGALVFQLVNGDGKNLRLADTNMRQEFLDTILSACLRYTDQIFAQHTGGRVAHGGCKWRLKTSTILPDGEIDFSFALWENESMCA